MRFGKNIGGFTVLEVMIAAAITVTIATFSLVGINTLLHYKKCENAKPKLTFEAYQMLDEIERDLENKSVSLGNLLINENAYPFQFQTNKPVNGYPSLSFFIQSPEGPRAVIYSLAPLPSPVSGGMASAVGLFRFMLNIAASKAINPEDNLDEAFSADGIVNLSNLLSENVVCFEVHLVRLGDDGLTLNYSHTGLQASRMYNGEWTVGSDHPGNIAFTEITFGLLERSQHGEYFALGSEADRRTFLAKNGVRLSRLFPWRI
jgi:hypothetical protein